MLQPFRKPGSRSRTGGFMFPLLSALWLVLTLPLTVLASRVDTFSGDVRVTIWIQNMSAPGVHKAVDLLNWFGRPIPLFCVMALIGIALLTRRRYLEACLIVTTSFVHAVNAMLKSAAASPRPTGEVVRVSDHASGFGFPSGHTMALVVFCGACVYIAWQLTARTGFRYVVAAIALGLVLGMGFSRVHSGAHWPTDVLGAYLWGSFYVLVLIAAHQWLHARLAQPAPRATELRDVTQSR